MTDLTPHGVKAADLHRAAHLMADGRDGSFAAAIAAAYFAADTSNRLRLLQAFGDLFERALRVHGAAE